MRIDAINLNSEVHEYLGIGIPTLPMEEALQMRDLEQCVVIAGKNGSGKTRLLSLLAQLVTKYLSPEVRRQIENECHDYLQAKKFNEAEVQRMEKNELRPGEIPSQLDMHRRNMDANEKEIRRRSQMLMMSDALTISGEGQPRVVFFVPKSTELKDPADGNEREMANLAVRFASGLGAENSHIGAPAYIRYVMRAAVSERGSREGTTGTEKHDAETALISTLESLLGRS